MTSKIFDAQEFNLAVYQVVKAIPPQKVITCGHIARLIGFPNQSRRVREAVNFISHTTPPVAWYRAVSTSGIISSRGSNVQKSLLEAEGVEVYTGSAGESRVALDRWGWFPTSDEFRLDSTFMASHAHEWGA